MTKTRSAQRYLLCLVVSIVLLQPAFRPTSAVADRSLSLAIDRAIVPLGQQVTITVSIAKESCRQHGHFLDMYIYDSQNFLIHRVALERAPEIGLQPEDFPVTVTYMPTKVDIYSVELFVTHFLSPGKGTYLEDTATFRVIPFVTVSQTTTLPTTTSLVVTTKTIVTTTTTRATVSITTEEKEIVTVGVTVLILLTAIAVALSILAAFQIGKRKGKELS